MEQIMLGPTDSYVLLKLVALGDAPWTQRSLASDLGVGLATVHRALAVGGEVRLYSPSRRRVNRVLFEEAIAKGARYFLGAKVGALVRGIRTAWDSDPLVRMLAGTTEPPLVWHDSRGDEVGQSILPLHPSAPLAARKDPAFYELLALVDALRTDGAGPRIRGLAAQEFHARLGL